MLQCVNGIDSLSPIQFEELVQEGDGTRARFSESLCNSWWVWWKLQALSAWQRSPTWHVLICWRTNQFEDDLELVRITISSENGLSSQHLSKYAAIDMSVVEMRRNMQEY
jgi:hypothetical protein